MSAPEPAMTPRQIAALVAPQGKVIGVDYSAEMIDEARARIADTQLPVEFVRGDAVALDFADASFDRCRCDRVLIHVTDPGTAVREMARVTRPGGLVVVSDIDVREHLQSGAGNPPCAHCHRRAGERLDWATVAAATSS